MHAHSHHHPLTTKTPVITATIIILAFAIIEALAGWWSHSLTLLSDAGHMGADMLALLFAAIASWLATRPSSTKHTFGLGRAEVIASWFSSLILLAITSSILVAAIHRFNQPQLIASKVVITTALVGFATNFSVAWILSRGEKTLNTRAALLHVLGDLLGSIAVLISGAVIHFTSWTKIDPILSIFICILIIGTTINLLRESLVILMEGVPRHIDVAKVEEAILKIRGIESIHDLHIWTISSDTTLLTAHIVIADCKQWHSIMHNIQRLLAKNYHIHQATLQAEAKQTAEPCIECANL